MISQMLAGGFDQTFTKPFGIEMLEKALLEVTEG